MTRDPAQIAAERYPMPSGDYHPNSVLGKIALVNEQMRLAFIAGYREAVEECIAETVKQNTIFAQNGQHNEAWAAWQMVKRLRALAAPADKGTDR
jgi:hypothetical protein